MIETSFEVRNLGWLLESTGWHTDENEIDALERELVPLYPANMGYAVYRLTRVEITQPGEDNGPVVA